MLIIVMPDGREWFYRNWIFRQLTADISGRYPDDKELRAKLDRATDFGVLDLSETPEALRQTMIAAMLDVIRATESGEIVGWRPEDPTGSAQYRQALSELASLLADQSAPS